MQTFLPLPSFEDSAECLDYKRLGKQRVEARQILTSIKSEGRWYNHPAVKMWIGYELALIHYGNIMIEEWVWRGYNNTMPLLDVHFKKLKYPPWFGNDKFHSSHRSMLLMKDYDYYKQFRWNEEPGQGYYWPL